MKKLISLILFISFISGCKSYVQVVETKSTNTVKKGEFYVFENDTIKVTYAFWSRNGILSFAIYNKLDIPIYIDWKKSSYVENSNKYNYWADKESSVSYSTANYYTGSPLLNPEGSITQRETSMSFSLFT